MHKILHVHLIKILIMSDIVKVRGRHGTNTLDIAIPAKLSKEFNINAGDLFKVDIINEDTIIIKYELIYKNK